jgi:cytochrome c553
MDIMARDLSDQDIADLVAWYASIQFSVSMPE